MIDTHAELAELRQRVAALEVQVINAHAARATAEAATEAIVTQLMDVLQRHVYVLQVGDVVQIMRDGTAILARITHAPGIRNGETWFDLAAIDPRSGQFVVKRSEMVLIRRSIP